MMKTGTLVGAAVLFVISGSVQAGEAAAAAGEPDVVTFKDGTVLKGEIVSMTEGSLTIKTAVSGEVKAKWEEVAGIKSSKPIRLVFRDGTELHGAVEPGGDGALQVTSPFLAEAATIQLDAVSAVNPPKKKAVTYKGNVNAGFSASDGNTRTKSGSLLAGFEARSERQRLTIGGSYHYSEDEGAVTERNSRGRMKYDFFPTDRLYVFSSAFLEYDKFQDLDLRTALSVGPGYQFIDSGDFESPYFSKLEFSGEAGVAYFNENFNRAPDNEYVSGRWAAKLDWPITPTGITFFHFHEGYPGFEEADDIYVSTEQGLRFAVWGELQSTVQVNWRWDNTPAPGNKRADTLFLLTLGYAFEM